MSQFQPFGYEGKEDTCLWCGRKLHYVRVMADSKYDLDNPSYRDEGQGFATVRPELPGPYQNGQFDTLNCGFRFGLELARHGHTVELA